MNVEKRITELIADEFGVEESQVTPNADLMHDFAADSLDIMELVITLEEEFEIEVADEDVEKLKRVSDVIELVTKLKAKAS
jgi:acyl carrier protein